LNHREAATVGPEVSKALVKYERRILELSAEVDDAAISQKLLMQLVMTYVQAEHSLRRLDDVKNAFVGMAAHDLRNPLIAIRDMSQMLSETDLDTPSKEELLKGIHDSSDYMLRLVNHLLDVAVIEDGKLHIRPEMSCLSTLVAARLRLLSFFAARKQITLQPLVESVGKFMFDADRMAQVVDTLVGNAIKFSPSGSTVQVALSCAGEHVELFVCDEGPGLSALDRERIGRMFQTTGTRPTAGEPGTGLGLAIVKKVLDAHHGTIELCAGAGSGSGANFKVKLPRHTEIKGAPPT